MRTFDIIADRGTVLIIVLWVSLGLVTLSLYFGHSMMYEYRAADNSASAFGASHTIEGARRYIAYVLENSETPGMMPDAETYQYEATTIGDTTFWLIGRGDDSVDGANTPVFGLVDEASKLNLNTVTLEMLELLPGMTTELAASIIDWRDEDSDLTPDGAESEDYLMSEPGYYCKDSAFETVEELRLLLGCDEDMLYGEDRNRNGVLESYEGILKTENQAPFSSSLNTLFSNTSFSSFGLLEYLTIYTREPSKREDGTARVNISDGTALSQLLNETFSEGKSSELSQGAGSSGSLLEYYIRSGMSADDFSQIYDALCATEEGEEYAEGLVNVNTAPAEVLACIPGIGEEYAGQLVAFRGGKTSDDLKTVAWVAEVLDDENAVIAGRFITTRTYQYSVDIAAVGHDGRGFRRDLFVIDASDISTSDEDSEGTVKTKVLYRKDLTRHGWPLGTEIRKEFDATSNTPKNYTWKSV